MVLMTTSDLPLERIARGKVRDVYAVDADRLLLVATDRVSAYDVVMAEPIPSKGAVLTQVIRDGAAAGEFRTDVEPQVAVLAILGMFNWMHRWYRPGGRRSLIEIGDEIVRLSLSALEPQPA